MSMPTITISNITLDNAISNVVASIALEEAAAAHVLNAEGEKLQAGLTTAGLTVSQLIDLDNAALPVINALASLEHQLLLKLEAALKVADTNPPVPPVPVT